MDDATKQALSEFVQKMLSAAESSAQWTADQAPLVVQEWLAWQLWSSVLIVAVSLLVVAVGSWVIRVSVVSLRDTDDPWGVGGLIGSVVCVLLAVLFGFENAMIALKVLVAPRVVVLEKFADLIK